MPPPQFEVELVNTRTAFNEALERSAPNVRKLGKRYSAMLDQYLDNLRKYSKGLLSGGSQGPFSSGAATKMDYKDSIDWALAEKERVSAALQAGKKRGGKR